MKMSTNEVVAKRIKTLLKEKKMTQYKLEQSSGILHGTMASIISNKNKTVTLNTLYMLAHGFEMTLLEFLDDPIFTENNINLPY